MTEHVRLFSDARAIQSERASDFDVYSAFGEVIDNSIEAGARDVRIKLKHSTAKQRGPTFQHIDYVAFGDNGHGMDADTLHHCLQLGYSSRYGSRKGIGRFGVGMTKGAISQCKRVEVYSRDENRDSWLFTYFDIGEIEKSGLAMIPEPVDAEIPDELSTLVTGKTGTLVVWRNFDRQDVSATKIVEEARVWIGRTFRTFIFDGVKFYIDGSEIKAIDPLYLHPEFTEFPDDPPATQWGEVDEFPWRIDDPDLGENSSSGESIIRIRHSILPEEFRSRGGGRARAGADPENVKRYIHRNEGISILRNGREVRDPSFDIPYWKRKFEDIDRWWGCEISFSAEIDNWFQVKNVKRGAAPLLELREELERRINPVRKTIKERVREHWNKIEQSDPPPVDLAENFLHGVSTTIAQQTVDVVKPIDKLGKDKEPESEIGKFVRDRFGEIEPDKSKAFVEYFRNNKITILDTASNSPNFFESTHFGDGKHNVTYNTNHVFSRKYRDLMDALRAADEESAEQKQIMILIDLLLVAYSIAESQFDPEAHRKAEDFLEDMMMGWGKSLRDLMKTWAEYES